jgi:pilus assembly protein CpaD
MNTRYYFLTLALLSGALQGCQTLAVPKDKKPEWKTEVQKMTDKEALLFKSWSVHLPRHELAKLHALLARHSALEATATLTAVHTPLNTKRIAALSKYLTRMGIQNIAHRSASSAELPNRNIITLEVTHYAAIPPTCPGWNESMGDKTPVEGEINFACTTEANLAKMIANPRDLIDSKTELQDARRQVRALNEYYEGKQKELKIEQVNAGKG